MKKIIALILTGIILTSFVPVLAEGPIIQSVSCTDHSGAEISDKIYANAKSINAVFSANIPAGTTGEMYFVSDDGEEILLDSTFAISGKVMNFYPERILTEGKKHLLKFSGTPSQKAEFYPVAEREDTYFYTDFGKNKSVSIYNSGGTFAKEKRESSLHGLVAKNTISSSCVNFFAEGISAENNYVIDLRMRVNALSDQCRIQLFDAIDSNKSWRIANHIHPAGKIYTRDGAISPYIEIGNYKKEEWFRYSVVYDIVNKKSHVYLNGVLAKADIPLYGAERPENFRIDLICKSQTAGSFADVEFDWVKMYSGTSLKSESYGASASEPTYYYNDFNSLENVSFFGSGGNFSQKQNYTLTVKSETGTTSGACADIIAHSVKNATKYVIDTKFKINSLKSPATVQLFDAKDEENVWRVGNYIHSNGNIYTRDSAVSQVNFGSWKAGEWIRYSVVYDTVNMKSDVYLNGVFAKSTPLTGCKNPYIFRIDLIDKSGSGSADVEFEKIKIYGGDTLLPWDKVLYASDSIMEGEMETKITAGDAMVFSLVSDYYIKDGVRKKYPANLKPSLSGENVILSPEFAKEFLSLNKTSSITAENAARELSKQYVYDDRGFFIICDNANDFKNSDLATLLFEKCDTLYRGVVFDNPRGEEVLHKLNNNRGGEHPRILYTGDEIQYIKSKIQEDSTWQNALRKTISDADAWLNMESYFSAEYAPSDQQNVARNFQDSMAALARGYFFTGNELYAQTAVTYMLGMANWQSLNTGVSNLTTGHYAMGMAIGYDSFYNYIKSQSSGTQTLNKIKDAAERLCISMVADTYKGGDWSSRWIRITDNFSGVCSGGMMAIALAFADESDLKQDIIILFENLLKTQSIAVSLYYPDGGYYEGVGYGEYSLSNLTLSIEALFKCCGTDFGLGRAKGFKESGEFFLHMQSGNRSFNYHDCSQSFTFTNIPLWFATRYEKTDALRAYKSVMENYGFDFDIDGLFFYEKAFGDESIDSNPSLDRYFGFTSSGTFRNTYDVKNHTFAGFHGGFTGLPHDMLDLGQFVFESDGVHWAMDLGKDSYSIPGYFSNDGYKIYRKKTEGENCLVINPSVNASSYYGQKIGAKSSLLFFDSSPSAAKAALDLTDAYSRDVTSYKRGYYFGDNRSTFMVQDELTLKSKSELYWFMHSEADIEILDADTAILTYDNKQLRAEVYSSEPFELKSLPATQLDPTLKVAKQSDDSYLEKLTVFCPDAEGSVVITVKLIPENDFVNATLSQPTSISSWTLPQTQVQSELKIRNQQIDESRRFVADVSFPLWAEEAEIYVENTKVQEFTPAVGVKYEFISSKPLNLPSGTYDCKLVAKGQGREEEVNFTLTTKSIGTKVIYENTLENFRGSEVVADANRRIYGFGRTFQNTGDGFEIVADMTAEDFFAYGAIGRYSTYGFNKGAIQIAFDVKFSTTLSSFTFECLNYDQRWFMHGEKIFDAGRLASNSTYLKDTWYRVKLIINFDEQMCKVYVKEADDGEYELVFSKKYANASSLVECKMRHIPQSKGQKVSFRNLSVGEINFYDEYINLLIDVKGKTAVTVDTNKHLNDDESLVLILAEYSTDEKRLLNINTHNFSFGDNLNGYSMSIPDPSQNALVKAFLWNEKTLESYKSTQKIK